MGMTGTTLSQYFNWLDAHLKTVEYGTVSLSFTVCNGSVTRVDKEIKESDKISLPKKDGR
jgi:hypothetical protein